MVLKGLKVLTGRVSDLYLSGHELPLVQNIRASGSCRVSKQCIWPLGSHPSSLLHMEEHYLFSEFSDSRHSILDKLPCSFAIQAGKGGKTDTLRKTLGKKNTKPCLIPCSVSPLALICLINNGCSTCMCRWRPRKVIWLMLLIFRGEINSTNPKLILLLKNLSVAHKGTSIWERNQ